MSHEIHDQLKQLLVAYYSQHDQGLCKLEADLDRYVSDEMSPQEREDLHKHLNQCPTCQKYLEEFQLTDSVWEEEQTPCSTLSRWFSLDLKSAYRLAAAAALVLIVFSVLIFPFEKSDLNQLGTKGSWQMSVAAKRNNLVFIVKNGDRLQTSDQLSFFYSSDTGGYLMILYVDSQGESLRIFPASRSSGQRVEAGQEVSLPDSAKLTPGIGCEWIVGVYSDETFQEDKAHSSIQKMLESRDGCKVRSWKKDGKPVWPGVDIKFVYVKR